MKDPYNERTRFNCLSGFWGNGDPKNRVQYGGTYYSVFSGFRLAMKVV